MMQTTGHAIESGMRHGLGRMMTMGISGELIYSFVIIACSLMIFFGTRELYNLSSHKGIKYFRLSFLFFALAYFFRSFIKIILFLLDSNELTTIIPSFGSITIFAFTYFSSMAIFYLLYSVMWKKWNTQKTNYLFHATAFIIAITTILFRNPTIYLLTNIILFIFIATTVYISYTQSKKKKSHNLYIIYLLLFIFWIFNIIDTLVPNFLQLYQLSIYLISLGIFLTILYKVIKKTG